MEEAPLEERIGEQLRHNKWRLALAESCTGGLLGHRITNIPGASDYFVGGIVAYANEVKAEVLGVPAEILTEHGAVSRPTVIAMARGVRRLLKAELGLAVSGIAGPSGGSPEKPVGYTWIGLSTPQGEETRSFIFSGNRLAIKEQAAEQALRLLWEHLREATFVEAAFAANGEPHPRRFLWRGEWHTVTSLGRRWQEGTTWHILVMLGDERVFELIYQSEEGRWRISPPRALQQPI